MSKKGAKKTGSGGLKRAKDAEMAKRLGPAPTSWRAKPEAWPYHNNNGTVHRKPGQ